MDKALLSCLFIFLLTVAKTIPGFAADKTQDAVYIETIKAIERLQENPDSRKAKSNLKSSYSQAVKFFESRKNYVLVSGDKQKYSKAIGYYKMLNQLTDELQACSTCTEVVKNTKKYYEELQDLLKHAAKERYDLGIAGMQSGARDGAKEAYYHYLKCNEFVPGYFDVEDRASEALFNAILKVVIEPKPMTKNTYGLNPSFFYDSLQTDMIKGNTNDFISFYTPQTAHVAQIQFPNHIVELRLDNFMIGDIKESEETVEAKNDSIFVEEKENDKGEKFSVYESVTATMNIKKKEVVCRGMIVLRITDYRSKLIVRNRKFPGRFVWTSEWGTFNGDERALNEKQVEVSKQEELDVPSPQDLFVEFSKPIYIKTTEYLKDFYKDF